MGSDYRKDSDTFFQAQEDAEQADRERQTRRSLAAFGYDVTDLSPLEKSIAAFCPSQLASERHAFVERGLERLVAFHLADERATVQ